MRRMLVSAAFVHAVVAVSFVVLSFLAPDYAAAGLAGPGPGVTGNDTGGIIQWTPAIDHSYREIAAAHCARWSRYAGISSVHRVYGDYIGFVCVDDRRFDPRKAGLPPQ
jgi:hypothetical protein